MSHDTLPPLSMHQTQTILRIDGANHLGPAKTAVVAVSFEQ